MSAPGHTLERMEHASEFLSRATASVVASVVNITGHIPSLVAPAETPAPETTSETVSNALDIVSLLMGCLIGTGAGFVIAFVLSLILRPILKRSQAFSTLMKRIRTPLYLAFMTWGAWAGLSVMLLSTNLSEWSNGALVGFLEHIILVAAIIATTGVAYGAAWVFEDAAKRRQSRDHGRARKFETQAQVIRRLLQALIVIIGVCTALFTFDATRQIMTTLLASAGLISVVAGLAAQQTLGNVFAGIQLAFTDAIRVGDVVVAEKTASGPVSGAVEEITLSYVVVRLGDERRLIVPSRYFTSNTFENWTRRAAKQLGNVELRLDWAAPITMIREKVEQLLLATDLWDGRSWAVQVSDSDEHSITVKIVVSAKNSGDLWDLRCYIRENLIHWIVTEEPWARPAMRIQQLDVQKVTHDMSRETVARLASELSGIAVDATGEHPILPGHPLPGQGHSAHTPSGEAKGTNADTQGTGGAASATSDADEQTGAGSAEGGISRLWQEPLDAVHSARLVAARRKAKRARRRAMAMRQREQADGHPQGASPNAESAGAPDDMTPEDATQVLSQSAIRTYMERRASTTAPTGESLEAGVPHADEEHNGGDHVPERTSAAERTLTPDLSQTAVFSPVGGHADPTTTTAGRGERLYSGSPDAEERSEIFAGPGEEVLAEREAVARRRQEEARQSYTDDDDSDEDTTTHARGRNRD